VNYMSTIERMVDREFEKLIADESPTTQQEFINYMNLITSGATGNRSPGRDGKAGAGKSFCQMAYYFRSKKGFRINLKRIQAECVGLEKWSDVTERLTIRLLELMESQKDLSAGTLWHKAFIEKYPTAVNLGGDRYLIKGKRIILQAVLAEDLHTENIIIPDPVNYLGHWICFYTYSVKLQKVEYIGWYEVKELPVENSYLIIPISEIKK
jgi:hypothetical protein